MNIQEQQNRWTPTAILTAQNPPHLLGDESDIRNIDGHLFPAAVLQFSDDEQKIIQNASCGYVDDNTIRHINISHKAVIAGRYTITVGKDADDDSREYLVIKSDENAGFDGEEHIFLYRGKTRDGIDQGLMTATQLADHWDQELEVL